MRRARGERGQILPIVALALVALLGIAAFAIDVGYAYYAQAPAPERHRRRRARRRPGSPHGRDGCRYGDLLRRGEHALEPLACSFTYTTKCTTTAIIATGCTASVNPNELVVTGSGTTNTWFAKLFGITHFDRRGARERVQPVLVDARRHRDRHRPHRIDVLADRHAQGNCTDLDNAKDGVRTMLEHPQPALRAGRHGRVPAGADDVDQRLRGALQLPRRQRLRRLRLGHARLPDRHHQRQLQDRRTALNTSSGLYLHTDDGPDTACIEAGGNTSYSEALRQAKAELVAAWPPQRARLHRLPDRRRGQHRQCLQRQRPDLLPPGNPDDTQPCHTAVNLANAYKSPGMTIYSIGYALGNNVNCTRRRLRAHDVPAVKVKGVVVTPAHPCTPFTAGCYHKRRPEHRESRRSPRTNALADRLARRLLQPAERRAAGHDLRRDRDRHRPGLEQAGGRWLLICDAACAARRARRSSSSASTVGFLCLMLLAVWQVGTDLLELHRPLRGCARRRPRGCALRRAHDGRRRRVANTAAQNNGNFAASNSASVPGMTVSIAAVSPWIAGGKVRATVTAPYSLSLFGVSGGLGRRSACTTTCACIGRAHESPSQRASAARRRSSSRSVRRSSS